MPRKKKGGKEEWGNGMGYFVKTKSVKVSGKKNIITVSFFTFKNAYNPLNHYGRGLLEILRHLNEYKSKNNILMRIYYDFSLEKWGDEESKETMEKLKAHPKVELVYCDFRQSVPEEKYNILTMLWRFIPFFDFPWEDSDNAYVLDIDLQPRQYEDDSIRFELNVFNKFINDKVDMMYRTPLDYAPFWYGKLFPGKKSAMQGAHWGGSLKMPHKIITSFVRSFLNNEDPLINVYKKHYFKYVKHLQKRDKRFKSKTSSKKTSQHCVSQFYCNYTYGFDEFFINCYVLPWAYKNLKKVQVFVKPIFGKIHLPLERIFKRVPKSLKDRFIAQFLSEIKYKKSLSFHEFHELFREYDWSGKKKKLYKLYEDFHKYLFKNYKSLGPSIDRKALKFLGYMDTYIHDGNSITTLSEKSKKEKYEFLTKNIEKLRK